MTAFDCSWADTGRSLATKTITRHPDGSITEQPYSNAKYFTFTRQSYPTLEAFAAALRAAATKKTIFLIRGELREGLIPRAANRRVWKEGDPHRTIDGPDRAWGVFDLDGVEVPDGLSFRQQLFFVRDEILPVEFANVRMVATATSSTGRKPGLRARLYFLLAQPIANSVLEQYAKALNAPGFILDGRVFAAGQPIYTARPVFCGMADPIPQSEWVFILDGEKERVELDPSALPSAPRPTAYAPPSASDTEYEYVWFEPPPAPPPEFSDPFLADLYAHRGDGILIEFSRFGQRCVEEAYARIVEAIPTQRHYTINRESFNIGQRVAEGHVPLTFVTGKHIGDLLLAATREMKHNDRYSEAELRKKIIDGLSEGVKRPRTEWGNE
jgi:hypothetical protein